MVELMAIIRPERSEAQSKDIFAIALRLRCTLALAGSAREECTSAQREVIFQKGAKMIHKILGITRVVIGIILVAIGGFFIIVLLTGGAPILPHIVGPITVAAIGIILLVFRRRVK